MNTRTRRRRRDTRLTVVLLVAALFSSAAGFARERPVTQTPTSDAPNFLGCFKDQGDPQGTTGRDLSGSISSNAAMTNAMCRSQCGAQGFKFAGTQAGTYCFCGNDYGKNGASNDCGTSCSGNVRERCGGIWANSVYPSIGRVVAIDKTQSDRFKNRFDAPPVGGGSMQPPPPPTNGGQCVISISGANYSHAEVQRWEVTGPPATQSGVIGTLRPLHWTATGTSGGVTIAAGADTALWVRSRADMHVLVSRSSAQICAAGALKTSPAGNWCEFGGMYPAPDLAPGSTRYDSVQQFVISAPAPAVNVISIASWGYQKPANVTGTATCEWHIAF